MSQMPPATWVTMDQVMSHLQVKARTTIIRWIAEGMPAHRVGRVWRFDLAEVDQWVRSGDSRWSTQTPGETA